MIQLIKRMIFAWRYKRAVARACKYAKLYGRKYYVLYMGGKLKVVRTPSSTEESTTSCIWVAN